MSRAVCLAAMIPARRAVCSGSPLATLPVRINESAAVLIVISPCASASRLVTGFAPTSTMRALPRSSTCDSRGDRARRLATLLISLRQVERETLERHGQIHALQLDVFRYLQGAGREVQNGFDTGCDDLIHDGLRMRRRHGDDGDVEPLTPHDPLELLDVVDRYPAPRLVANLLVGRIEERGDLEPFLTKPGVISERETEIAGAHDGHAQLSIEAENLPQVPAQFLDVIADAAHAELAEVREILANLGGVEMELLGERLG